MKKVTGSIIRTGMAVLAGYAMADLDVATIEYILTSLETFLKVNKEIIGIIGAVVVQLASIVEKKRRPKESIDENFND